MKKLLVLLSCLLVLCGCNKNSETKIIHKYTVSSIRVDYDLTVMCYLLYDENNNFMNHEFWQGKVDKFYVQQGLDSYLCVCTNNINIIIYGV